VGTHKKFYGFVSKQTDTAQSDIDVMWIEKKLLLSKALELLVRLDAQLGGKIKPTCYTSAAFERRCAERDSFVNRVLARPVLPLVGDASEPARSGYPGAKQKPRRSGVTVSAAKRPSASYAAP